MIRANIDAFRQIGIGTFPSKPKVTLIKSSAAQISGVNDDCFIHYYIQQQNASIASPAPEADSSQLTQGAGLR